MSLHESNAAIDQALKAFRIQWEAARATWRDTKAVEFEETYLQDLPNFVARASNAIEELARLLRKFPLDCD
jgi:hypothetical protein